MCDDTLGARRAVVEELAERAQQFEIPCAVCGKHEVLGMCED